MSFTAARNLLRRHYDSYDDYSSMMIMTDDDEHQQQNQANQQKEEQEHELAGASSSRRVAETGDSWLQLGIGPSSSSLVKPAVSPSVELDLFSDKPPSSSTTPRPSQQLNIGYIRPPSPWGFTTNYSMNMQQAGGTSTSLMNMPRSFNYNVQRFSILSPPPPPMRVVRMPARSGVWFILKAADNQVREPFLPQIPKSYLRIKDGRMAVRLLMKYLVNKLGLIDESEGMVPIEWREPPPSLGFANGNPSRSPSLECPSFFGRKRSPRQSESIRLPLPRPSRWTQVKFRPVQRWLHGFISIDVLHRWVNEEVLANGIVLDRSDTNMQS